MSDATLAEVIAALTVRAEVAEAQVARVRALADEWANEDHPTSTIISRELLAALDGPLGVAGSPVSAAEVEVAPEVHSDTAERSEGYPEALMTHQWSAEVNESHQFVEVRRLLEEGIADMAARLRAVREGR